MSNSMTTLFKLVNIIARKRYIHERKPEKYTEQVQRPNGIFWSSS